MDERVTKDDLALRAAARRVFDGIHADRLAPHPTPEEYQQNLRDLGDALDRVEFRVAARALAAGTAGLCFEVRQVQAAGEQSERLEMALLAAEEALRHVEVLVGLRNA